MKRLIKNSIYVVIIAGILIAASQVYEKPRARSEEIQGKTPSARITSIVNSLNAKESYKKIGRASSTGYDANSQSWNFSLMIFKSAKELQEADQQIIFSFVKEIFLKAASQVSSNTRINILMMYSNGTASFISMSPEGIKEMKRYKEAGDDPADWYRYIIEIPAAIQLQQTTPQDKQTDQQQGENQE